ncbi:hypothetical protein GUJ93_ZPchr0007g5665 [Zizania palustris]|uniref:Uncharacterized protein n=1 Tax=Zizania palustris TaxID=103762 RepID=A0A8J5W5B4_ZIZPA|nr:hypothetical protein GUJ93_ZPchr0007g5665 [Zizania palustris]
MPFTAKFFSRLQVFKAAGVDHFKNGAIICKKGEDTSEEVDGEASNLSDGGLTARGANPCCSCWSSRLATSR